MCKYSPLPPETWFGTVCSRRPGLSKSSTSCVFDLGKLDQRQRALGALAVERRDTREPVNQVVIQISLTDEIRIRSSAWWAPAGTFSTGQNEPENDGNQTQAVPTGGQHYCP